jgi:predicted phage terminase large subunit-like protein
MEREPEEWTVLHMPAICDDEATDPLGRKLGEPLWPAQRPLDFLEKLRKSLGSKAFSALYQGRPLAADGNLIKEEWLGYAYDELPCIEYTVKSERSRSWLAALPGSLTVVTRPLEIIQFVDCSWGMGNGDWSVIATVGTDYRALYIIDIARGRWQHVDLTHMVEAKYNQYRPRVVCVEAAQAGFAVIQSLKALNRIPILAIPPRGSKIGRVEAITPLMESGQVLWPREAPWKQQAQDECRLFPNGTFDDVPDALAGAITSLWANVKLRPDMARLIGRRSAWESKLA